MTRRALTPQHDLSAPPQAVLEAARKPWERTLEERIGRGYAHPFIQALLVQGYRPRRESRPQCGECRSRSVGPRVYDPSDEGAYTRTCERCGHAERTDAKLWHHMDDPKTPPELLWLVAPLAAALGSVLGVDGTWESVSFESKLGLCWTADTFLASAVAISRGLPPP